MELKKVQGITFMADRILATLLLGYCLAMTMSTHADNYEITAVAGHRISDSLEDETNGTTIDLDETSSFAFILSSRRDADSFYDFLFSRQDTILHDSSRPAPLWVRLDYYHIGGTVYYENKQLYPFAAGGLGFTRILSGDSGLSPETRLSMSIAGGLKFPLSDQVSLRLEARVYGTLIDANGSILCANGSCAASLNGDMYLQFETSLGLAVAF